MADGRGPRHRRSASRSPSAGSTARRCAAGRTPPRSSPWPPTASGSRSAASPRAPVRALAAEEALARGDIDARGRAVRRGRRPVRRRLRQRLVPPPRPARPRPPSSEPMPSSVIELEINGEPQEFLAPPGTTLLSALRDTLGLTAAKRGCGAGHVRHLHLPARRRRRHVLPGAGRDDQRRLGQDARGRGRAGRHAGAAPAGLPGRLRHPVRLLHARHDHGRRGAARGEPGPDARGRRARDQRQRLPLHGLREHHPRRSSTRRSGWHERRSTSSASPSSASDAHGPRHRPHAVLRGRQPGRAAAPEDAPLRAPPREARSTSTSPARWRSRAS